MYPRTNYEMTERDLETLLDACKPTICIQIGGYSGSTPQENANRAWAALGKKMGFDSDTVQPIDGKGSRFFTAVPTENEIQRAEREKREGEEKRKAEVAELEAKINKFQARLKFLTTP